MRHPAPAPITSQHTTPDHCRTGPGDLLVQNGKPTWKTAHASWTDSFKFKVEKFKAIGEWYIGAEADSKASTCMKVAAKPA